MSASPTPIEDGAAGLEELRTRLAQAERERDEAQREHTDMMWQRRRAEERAEAAEARLAQAEATTNRMREALIQIATAPRYSRPGCAEHGQLTIDPQATARAALTPPVTTETVSTGGGADADESAALSTTGRDPAAPTSEWQDIASAPKDGSEVDLWANGRRYTDCHFHQGEWLHWAHGGVDDEPAWAVVIGATHYRPLPPAPSQERDEPMEDASPNATSQGGE